MRPSSSDWASIFFWVILGGLIVWAYNAATLKKVEKSEAASSSVNQLKKSAQAAISAGPQLTSWQTAEGTVISLSIPKLSAGGHLLEVKKCIIWRDAITKTASLHCDRDKLDLTDAPVELPDLSDYR